MQQNLCNRVHEQPLPKQPNLYTNIFVLFDIEDDHIPKTAHVVMASPSAPCFNGSYSIAFPSLTATSRQALARRSVFICCPNNRLPMLELLWFSASQQA